MSSRSLSVDFAAQLGGNAGPEGAGRNNGVFGNDGTGGDDAALADAAVVQDVAPMPMTHMSSTTQPWTVALWPMVTQSPTMTG